MITEAAWIALLVAAGFPDRQAVEIAKYSAVEAAGYRGPFNEAMALDECAGSPMAGHPASPLGESLLGVTGELRRELHEVSGYRGCVPVSDQARYLWAAFPFRYPECSARFLAQAHGLTYSDITANDALGPGA